MTTTNKTGMTEQMIRALILMMRNGAVFSGGGNEWARGCLVSVAASCIEGLARRGFCEIATCPDGGIMGRPPGALHGFPHQARAMARAAS